MQESQQLNAHARDALEAGNLQEALTLLGKAIGVCPWWEVNFNDLGVILWQLGRHDEAYTQFVRAVRLNAAFNDARENLMQAAAALGRLSGAREVLGEADG